MLNCVGQALPSWLSQNKYYYFIFTKPIFHPQPQRDASISGKGSVVAEVAAQGGGRAVVAALQPQPQLVVLDRQVAQHVAGVLPE